jgi:hypothetical protein
MPPYNNTLQTTPELRNQIYHTLARTLTRVILGRKFLASQALGEHDRILPVQFACATALEPLSMTRRQLNLESGAILATAPDPPVYHVVVNNINLNLDQLDLFEDFTRCPMDCPRNFQLRFQFDSESALELKRCVAPMP